MRESYKKCSLLIDPSNLEYIAPIPAFFYNLEFRFLDSKWSIL